MQIFLDEFRAAGSDWFIHEATPEIQEDKDGRKFYVVDEDADAIWVPRNSPLGQEIAAVLGE